MRNDDERGTETAHLTAVEPEGICWIHRARALPRGSACRGISVVLRPSQGRPAGYC